MSKADYFPYAFFEGKIVPTEKAKISIMTNALQYGTAIFAGIRVYGSFDGKNLYIFRLEDHYGRFLNSLSILDKKIAYDKKDLIKITKKLIRKNKPTEDAYIRPFAYAVNLQISPDLAVVDFDFAAYMIPLGEYLPVSKGLSLSVSSWTRIADNMMPARGKIAGSYVNSALAKQDAVRVGFDDTLMLDGEGHICEASSANFFMVRDGVLITSPKYSDILEGITRRTVISLAGDIGIDVEEKEIDRSEVYLADEAFLCGTGVQVAWIGQIDGRKIGTGKIGPITSKFQKLFFDIVRGKEKKYNSWLTKI